MRLIKRLLLALSLVMGYPNLARSYWWQEPRQVVRPSHDGVSAVNEWALLIRKPLTGGVDTIIDDIGPYPYPVGCWVEYYQNFQPWLKLTDTLYAMIEVNTPNGIYKVKSKWSPSLDNNIEYFWDVYLDDPNKPVKAFAVNIDDFNLNPNIGLPDSMYLWLYKNPYQKIKGEGPHQYAPYMTSFNLEKQDSIWQQGDSARINLEKILTFYTPDGHALYNKNYFTKIDFAIDTFLIACMGFRTVNFPEDSSINDVYAPIIDSISHNLIDGYASLKARIRDYSNVYDTLFYKIKWQGDSLLDKTFPDSIVNNYHYYTISGIPPNQQCTVYCDIKAIDTFNNIANAYYDFYAHWTGKDEKTYVINKKDSKSKRLKVFYLGKEDKRIKKLLDKGYVIYDVSGRLRKRFDKNKGIYIIRRE